MVHQAIVVPSSGGTENFEAMYGSFPSPQPTWLLGILKTRVVPIVPIEPAIPEKITTMHKSQMESHPKVNIIFKYYTFYVIKLCPM